MLVDPDDINRDWLEGGDPARAIELARRSLQALVDDDLPMSHKIAQLEAAAEPMLDAPGGDPMFLYRVVNALSKENQGIELQTHLAFEERMSRRVTLTRYRARALHCGDHPMPALEQCLAAHDALERMAGGRDALLAALGNRPPNLVAASTAAIVGVFAASIRRALPIDHPARRYWVGEMRAIVDASLPDLDASRAAVYPDSPSLVQVLYLLAEDRDPLDAERIRALRAFDMRVRPTHRRGQSTIPLREVAVARYEGDDTTAAQQSERARDKLNAQQLPRHLVNVEKFDYINPPEEGAA